MRYKKCKVQIMTKLQLLVDLSPSPNTKSQLNITFNYQSVAGSR